MRTRIASLMLSLAIAVILIVTGTAFYYAPRRNPTPLPADYRVASNWLCRPGRPDACAANLAATVIAADGTTSTLTAEANADAAIDCFYVYPTASNDPHENAPLVASPAEAEVAAVQFARFRTICRTYAPLYRQITLRSLLYNGLNLGHWGDSSLAYADVRAAWLDYLAHDNRARGFVLIGHSQGSRMLKQLLHEEIEGRPAQSHLIAALLTGNSVIVPKGKTTGGDFRTIPICSVLGQFGCVIAYSSFRANAPPAPNPKHAGEPGFYGLDPGNGMTLACTNPAALAGGKAVLDAYLPTRLATSGTPWVNPPVVITTDFVTVPGLISGECLHEGGRTYLAISFNGAPTDHRRNNINGDVKVLGKIQRGWGLHTVDMNLVQGDLIRAVQAAAQSYQRANTAP